jgi:hypothetical protein
MVQVVLLHNLHHHRLLHLLLFKLLKQYYLRPDTETGIKRKRSRRDRLGLTNRGVSQFSFSPSAGLGGFGQGGGSQLGI